MNLDLAYQQTYPLRHGFSVTFKLDGLRLECAWWPDVPKGKRARQILPHYREARGKFIRSLGVTTLVLEA